MKTIYVKDFTKYPGPRYITLGDFSGEEFRDSILIPELVNDDIIVNFDGVYGYGSSFLEEAFGGLVRAGIDINKIKHLRDNLICKDDPTIIIEVQIYIDEALKGARNA
ncbi:STAS-like domain-containing protein [Kluyvera cryocrescens]|uniref:STAS-like domain-containing protein n=1 Tax=Kluyvera cryocrescens TaxID=580 RepID=UPI0028AE5750|nr:STAS-like domain-containing protein [Kluyvera cryocrescens]